MCAEPVGQFRRVAVVRGKRSELPRETDCVSWFAAGPDRLSRPAPQLLRV